MPRLSFSEIVQKSEPPNSPGLAVSLGSCLSVANKAAGLQLHCYVLLHLQSGFFAFVNEASYNPFLLKLKPTLENGTPWDDPQPHYETCEKVELLDDLRRSKINSGRTLQNIPSVHHIIVVLTRTCGCLGLPEAGKGLLSG